LIIDHSSSQHLDAYIQFENSADQVLNASNENVRTVFETLSTLSQVTTTFLMQEHLRNNGAYPRGFVTIPNTEYHLARVRQKIGAHVLTYAPTVEKGDYALWSQYVEKNLGWLNESYIEQGPLEEQLPWQNEVQSQIWSVVGLSDSSVCFVGQEKDIAEFEVHLEDPEDGPATPIWTISPPPKPTSSTRINFDMTSSKVFSEMTDIVAAYRTATFHDICNLTSVS
jgi:hypothetical protein